MVRVVVSWTYNGGRFHAPSKRCPPRRGLSEMHLAMVSVAENVRFCRDRTCYFFSFSLREAKAVEDYLKNADVL